MGKALSGELSCPCDRYCLDNCYVIIIENATPANLSEVSDTEIARYRYIVY